MPNVSVNMPGPCMHWLPARRSPSGKKGPRPAAQDLVHPPLQTTWSVRGALRALPQRTGSSGSRAALCPNIWKDSPFSVLYLLTLSLWLSVCKGWICLWKASSGTGWSARDFPR